MFQCNYKGLDYREVYTAMIVALFLLSTSSNDYREFHIVICKAVNSLEFPGSPPAQY